MRSIAAAAIAAMTMAGGASAAVISNGVVALGVDSHGQLNVRDDTGVISGIVGLRDIATNYESTSNGCLCEGWGVGIADAGGARIDSGSANNDRGVSNLDLVSFTSTATTATSVTKLSGRDLTVTHDFGPAAETSSLFRVKVTIANNTGADIADLRYTRTFDWDVDPDTFNEYVTHLGVAGTPTVLLANDNGFEDSDPFASRSNISAGGIGDFTDLGPTDHGSNFDFGFGALKDGESFSFDIFYGAATTEALALAALGEVKAEVASLGQPSRDINGVGEIGGVPTRTFIFGFASVGGAIVVPDPTPDDPSPVPLPAAAWMLLSGFAAMGGMRMVRRVRA